MQETGQFPISRIKISPPIRRPEIVSRPRLMEELHDQLDQKLILVVAPAGYGKTTLLLDMASSSEVPVCWLTLDSLDQDPQRFLNYLVYSIANCFPNFGKESLSALESMVSVEADSERLIIAITNEIRARIFEHFLLVLDDYHLVDVSNDVRRLVSRFVQLAGENVHLLLASRSLPTIPDMPLLVARGLVSGLSFEDLAFLPEEISQYFIQNSGRLISDDEARQLAAETEGWIAAIHLSNALTSLHVPARPFSAFADLFDFFASEVLDKQSPEIREFLLVTSLFEAFDATLCRAVLDSLLPGEPRPWPSLIAAVQANNVFTVPLGHGGQWIRYHNMFKQFLVSQLLYEQPTLSWHIQKQLARYYEQSQSWEEALHLYDSLGDHEGLLGTFDKAGPYFLSSGKVLTLANWLDRVPIGLQHESPIILSLQGAVSLTQGNTQLSISLLSQAEELLRQGDDCTNLARTLNRRASAYRQTGQFERARRDADEALTLTESLTDPDGRAMHAEALRMKGQAEFRLDRIEAALHCLKSSLALYSDLEMSANIPILEMELGMLSRAAGDSQGALRYYESALMTWQQTGNLGWQASLLNNMGVLHHQQGRFAEAFSKLEDALTAAERSGYVRTEALAYNSLSDLLYDLHDTEQAEFCQSKSLELATKLSDSFLIFYDNLTRVRLTRQAGRPHEALDLVRSLIRAETSRTSYRLALLEVEEGSCLLATGHAREAVGKLKEALELFVSGGRTQELCSVRLWLVAALGYADPKAAMSEFEDLASQGCNPAIVGPLHVSALHCFPWLNHIVDKTDFASEPFRAFMVSVQKYGDNLALVRRQLRQASKRIEISPPRIEVRTLGFPQVHRDGQVLTLSDWQTREARDLFFFLMFSPPQTKEQIALVFWPDISPARLKLRFKSDIYRIRQALGQNVITFEDEFYQFNKYVDHSCDVDEFHALLAEAQETDDPQGAMSLLKRATELVQGPFLADMDATWVNEIRSGLSKEYYAALFDLAERYLSAGDPENCLLISQRAMALDPLQERVYRLRMQAYAALRDRPGLARQYQECKEVFRRELGITPSHETAMLYERLAG
jgi:ATP/maltotriose-dependent transcriptional regulator MalT/two-component SAPR family response regulator